MRIGALAIAFILFIGLVVIPGHIVRSTEADSTLVVAALRALEQNYFKAVDPVALLNAAIAGLRKATSLATNVLPDIPAGVSEAKAIAMFQQRFARAVQSGKTPQADLAYRATREMVASLQDPLTYYDDPAQYAELKKTEIGAAGFTGIGVSIVSRKDAAGIGWIFITDVYPDSPAQAAGLRLFDRILEVDGKPLRDIAVTDASRLIRGQAGSTVTLVIQRGNERLTASATRASIQLVPWAQMIRPGVAYLRILFFSQGTAEWVRSAVHALSAQASIRAVILDLRGNSGGSYRELLSVAGVFLPPETVVAQAIAHGQTFQLKATGESLLPTAPIVVLSDDGTVAASEILAEGLRTVHQAKIIGVKTAGIGRGGVEVPLPAGGMYVTVEEVMGPRFEPIHGVGVTPDIRVELTEADMERGSDSHLDAALSALLK